jgi:hypothetical protein
MESPKLIREVESEEFIDSSLEEETEIFEKKEKKDKDKVILG